MKKSVMVHDMGRLEESLLLSMSHWNSHSMPLKPDGSEKAILHRWNRYILNRIQMVASHNFHTI